MKGECEIEKVIGRGWEKQKGEGRETENVRECIREREDCKMDERPR